MRLDELDRRLPLAFPFPHVMGLASLDAWARMLLAPPAAIAPRYWLRLGAGLATSAVGTALTLPERLALAPILHWRYRAAGGRLDHEPGVVVILGYYRTGTTHLHYLLSRDPRFVTPRWAQTLAPQGFVASWWFLRWFLVPFLLNRRPQDDVAYGPEWPAEDDFALCNWTVASPLPGRLVLPKRFDHYARFHALEGLSAVELERWRRTLWAFCWKIIHLRRERTLLLKTPSHTARVEELQRLFGRDRVKFIHISRRPDEVVRSNVAMLRRLSVNHLQDAPDDATLEARVVEEYAATQRRYLAARDSIPQGHLAEMRFEDLRGDPLGQLRRVYDELGIEWSAVAERRFVEYLDSVRDYEPQHSGLGVGGSRLGSPPCGTANAEPRTPSPNPPAPSPIRHLQFIIDAFNHDSPPLPRVDPPRPAHSRPSGLTPPVAALTTLLAVGCAVGWVMLVRLTLERYNALVWPIGILLGAVALRWAGRGTRALGLFAAALTLAVCLAVAVPNSREAYYRRYDPQREHVTWVDLRDTSIHELTSRKTLFWIGMGLMSAYRFASRNRAIP